jgi:hypothetical protein
MLEGLIYSLDMSGHIRKCAESRLSRRHIRLKRSLLHIQERILSYVTR